MPLQKRSLEQPRHQQRHNDAEQIHPEHRGALQQLRDAKNRMRWNASRDQQGVNRQPRGAAHQRRDENGYQPVFGGFNGARSHDAGNRTCERTQHRDETLAMQSDLAHQAIHQKRGPRHVARVFEEADEEKQNDKKLGENAPDASK